MDPPPKKQKASEKLEVAQSGSGAQNAEAGPEELQVEHGTMEFPPLVFSLVVATVKDASFLKTARLVCKSWNVEATTALRDCSFVKFNEATHCDRFNEFRALLGNGRIGSRSDLPSPFLYYVLCKDNVPEPGSEDESKSEDNSDSK